MRIFVTPHIAELFHKPEGMELAKMDWLRAGRFLRGTYPKPLPEIREWTFDTQPLKLFAKAPYLVIDTEYPAGEILTLGIGGPSTPILQWWRYKPYRQTVEKVRDELRQLIRTKPIIFQNAYADIPLIAQDFGITVSEYLRIDDTMQLDSVLWCELGHSLEEATRRHGWHEKLKHLPMSDPRYNAGDVAETINFWEALKKEVRSDPQSWAVYNESMLPLIPIILEAQQLGLRVDTDRAVLVGQEFERHRRAAMECAAAYCGFPLNLGSPGADGQLGRYLEYDLVANWGFKQSKSKGVTKPLIQSVGEDRIAELRGLILPFDPQEEPSIAVMEQRIADGGHPILEARVLYARATQWLSHYIKPMLASPDGRVYPHFHPWTQNTGRWSTVNPPMAQLPNALRDAILPDEGWDWVEGDWSGIELRVLAALSRDQFLLEAFAKDWDLHTLHMCEFFGYPLPTGRTKEEIAADAEWIATVRFVGGADPRRVFAKQAVFRLCYGGKPEGAPTIPGAKTLGLKDADLVAASRRWLAKHPTIRRFWKTLEREGLRTRTLRTFNGRRWKFMGHDRNRILRQMYNFPMQGAVAVLMNLTLIAIKQALGSRVRLSYTMHDSLKLQVRQTPHLEEDVATIQAVFEQGWDVNGTVMGFPGEYHRRVG